MQMALLRKYNGTIACLSCKFSAKFKFVDNAALLVGIGLLRTSRIMLLFSIGCDKG